MCIAILKTKKGIISDEALRESFRRNSDGAGIAYTLNNKLIIEKGIFNVEQFIKAVRRIEAICDNNMLIHCRIGTSGKKDKANTHPFSVSENVCLIHNGILDIKVPEGSDKNDTRLFIERYLKDISDYDLLHNKCIKKMIAKLIGSSNKFVLMDNKGYYKIINEQEGHWKDDVWYSNSSYVPYANNKWYGYSSYPYDYYGYNYYDEDRWFKYDDDDDLYDDIDRVIKGLSVNELKQLGYEPVWNFSLKCLLSEEMAMYTGGEYQFLSDLSIPLYNQYLDKYEFAEEVA